MSFKVYYMDARGLVEPLRAILSYGGIEFEDIRIPVPILEVPIKVIPTMVPPEIKERATWGKVPFGEFEGKKLAQSLAITRYFARRFDLVGDTDFEAAQCDEFVDVIFEFTSAWYQLTLMANGTEEKIKKRAEIHKVTDDKYLYKFEEILKSNGTGWLVGKRLSWADICLCFRIENVEIIHEVNLLEDINRFPLLEALRKKVFSVPKIQLWIQKRPITKY